MKLNWSIWPRSRNTIASVEFTYKTASFRLHALFTCCGRARKTCRREPREAKEVVSSITIIGVIHDSENEVEITLYTKSGNNPIWPAVDF